MCPFKCWREEIEDSELITHVKRKKKVGKLQKEKYMIKRNETFEQS